MSFFKKKPQGAAELRLASHRQSARAWLSDEDITGCAVFKLPPGVKFSHSKILLKGVVTTRTENQPGALQRSWRTEKLPFLAVALDSKAGPDFASSDGVIQIPFRFNLDECRRTAVVPHLPPTLDSQDDAKWYSGLKNSNTTNQFDISYSISASAFSARDLIASTARKITILPVTEAHPPLSPSDFAGEYFLAAASPVEGKRMQRATGHRIELAGQEPEPISLDLTEDSTQSTTEIPFVVKILPKSGDLLDPDTFPDRCELKARLITRTFVTPNGRTREMPTVDDALDDEDSFVRTSRNNEQAFTLAIPRWDQFATGSMDQFAIARFPFLFTLNSEHQQLSPTFFTPILSRRYAIECKLSFPGNPSSNLSLSLPLQIVYKASELDLGVVDYGMKTCV